MFNALKEHLTQRDIRFISIDGSTKPKTRQEHCDNFQYNKDVKFAVLSMTACAFGLNLTAANLVIFAELFWNPGVIWLEYNSEGFFNLIRFFKSLLQAEDRAHRIGQTKPVTIQYLLAKGTADDYIWPILKKKLDFLSKTGLSNEEFEQFEVIIILAIYFPF